MREFTNLPIERREAEEALDRAVDIVRRNIPVFAGRCQNHSSVGGIYPACDNVQWTCGFWPGELWLGFERTGESVFRDAALELTDSFLYRVENGIELGHHDMGFLYSPSCVAAWKLTGSEKGRRAALMAAQRLGERFCEKGSFIQAWGRLGEPDNYRYIIDCLLNVPLLYWAAENGGGGRCAEIARRHTATCLANSIRPDGSTYHTFFMDPATGKPLYGATCQGYRDDSCWARGQAWGVYGTALGYRYDPNSEYLDAFRRVLGFYLERLPEDMVPYWDMIFKDGDGEPRDSSSASIVACGLLEAAKHVPEGEGEGYRRLAAQMLGCLARGYAVREWRPGSGIVLHGTYSKKSPYNTCTPEGVDECVSWGDYFYMEALTRFLGDWEIYW